MKNIRERAFSNLPVVFRLLENTGSRLRCLLPVLFLAFWTCFGTGNVIIAGAEEETETAAVLAETEEETETAAESAVTEEETAEAVETAADGDEADHDAETAAINDNYRNFYEIFVYSFYDSDGDGIGDLNGVREKLDYIEEMGFDGIWLMPIMPSTTYHKYDVTDYYGIDEEYGTLEDFQSLVEECHERGIKVVIDFVINHTSSQHEWFQEACAYLATLGEDEEPDLSVCPYVGYYHFSREQETGDYYAIPVDSESDWYYEGVFWSEMPDLDLSNEELRAELEDIAAYWIDMGVDGFRMDAALHFEESDTAFNTEVLNWLYTYCVSLDPDFYMVSEVWANESTIADYYASGTPSMFNFDMAEAEGKLIKAARGTLKVASLIDTMIKWQEDFSAENPDYIDAAFISNHDTGRISNAVVSDENDVKMAAGLLMTMSGSTYVYYGEEIGMKSKGSADENKRLPMIWSETDTTGMTNGPADAEEGITSSFAAVDEQLEDETSILNYYKRAIALRKENPEIARGTIEKVEELCDGYQGAILKTWNDSTIAILYNTSDEEMTIDLSDTALSGMVISGYLTLNNEEITLDGDTVVMPAQSILVLR